MNLLLAAVLLLQDTTAEEQFKRMEDSVVAAKSVSVKFKITIADKGKLQLAGSGALLLKHGNKLNYTIKTLEEEIYDKEFRFVSDGSKIKGSYHRENKGVLQELVQVTPEDLLANFISGLCKAGLGGPIAFEAVVAFLGESGPNPKTVPLRWKEVLSISDLRQGTDGKEGLKGIGYKLHFRPNSSAPAAEMKVWIDPKTGMPATRTFTLAEYTITETYEEFKLNGDIADEKFKLPEEKK